MPADPRDLCNVADVKSALFKKTSDTGQDVFIQDLITDASVHLMDEYEQEWAPTTASAARVFEFRWEDELMSLAPYALRTVSSIVVDSDQGAGVALSTDEWRLEPQPPKDGVYTAIHLRPFSAALGRTTYRNRQVTITGAWGYSAVPRNVKRACVMTVRHWLVTSTGSFRHADDPTLDVAPVQRGIPPEARELLRRFRPGGALIG